MAPPGHNAGPRVGRTRGAPATAERGTPGPPRRPPGIGSPHAADRESDLRSAPLTGVNMSVSAAGGPGAAGAVRADLRRCSDRPRRARRPHKQGAARPRRRAVSRPHASESTAGTGC